MNVDYSLKAKIIANGLDLFERDISKCIYFSDFPNVNFVCPYSKKMALFIENYFLTYFPDEWNEAKKVNHAYYQRVCRLKKYIHRMLRLGDCLFLTFTFTDDILSSTSYKTRKSYITRFLKSYNTLYCANIDFGKENGREHYHSVILQNKVDNNNWSCGALNFERVKKGSSDVKLAKYVSKLTNHAIKETVKRSCVIYSRLNIDEFEKNKYIEENNLVFEKLKNYGIESFDVVDESLVFEPVYEQDCLFN